MALRYLLNEEIPPGDPLEVYASVGIGNIKLPTAEMLWTGHLCNYLGENCVDAQVSPLRTRSDNPFLSNPFVPTVICATNSGACFTRKTSTLDAYSTMGSSLVDNAINIEYAAALLEAGAIRVQQLGEQPNLLNSVMWYTRGVSTVSEIQELVSGKHVKVNNPLWIPTVWVPSNMPTAKEVLLSK